MSESTTLDISSPWPPPPDIDSIRELVNAADTEGFIGEGGPADEYDTEADLLFKKIRHLKTAELLSARLLPILNEIWQKDFDLDEEGLSSRAPKLADLAGQIERFFGPQAEPQVRGR